MPSLIISANRDIYNDCIISGTTYAYQSLIDESTSTRISFKAISNFSASGEVTIGMTPVTPIANTIINSVSIFYYGNISSKSLNGVVGSINVNAINVNSLNKMNVGFGLLDINSDLYGSEIICLKSPKNATWTWTDINELAINLDLSITSESEIVSAITLYVHRIQIVVQYSELLNTIPNLKCRIDGNVKSYADGWVRVDSTLRKIDSMWTRVDGVLKKI
jgi:hypothetical protein